MIIKLPMTLLVCLLGLAGVCQAQPAALPNALQSTDPAAGDQEQGNPLAETQSQVAQRFKRLESVLLRSAEIEAATNPTRAELLTQAAKLAQELQLANSLSQAAKSLEQKQYRQAVDDQKASRDNLKKILELLQYENRPERDRQQRDQVKRWIEEADRLLRLQSSLRGRTEGGTQADKAASDQEKLANKAGEIAKELQPEDAAKEGEQTDDPQDGQKSDSSKEGDQSKDSQGSKDKSDQDSNGKDSGDKNKDSEKKDDQKKDDQTKKDGQSDKPEGTDKPDSSGKPADDQQSKDAQKSDGQKSGGQKSDGQKSDDAKDGSKDKPKSDDQQKSDPSDSGKPSQSKPGDQSQPSQQTPSQSQDSQSPEGQEGQQPPPQPKNATERAAQKIKQAQKRMQEAQEKLEKAERDGAVEKQRQAEQELQQAIEQLEEILRQLREEEIERSLAALEERLRLMLRLQNKVLDDTKRLQEIGGGGTDRQVEIRAGSLAGEQRKILNEGQRALLLLREEGTSAAFPENLEQIIGDMQSVADRLAKADIGKQTVAIEQEIVSALEDLVNALAEVQKDKKDRKQQPPQAPGQGQQGQPGEQPLVDQLAEMRLIKTMQLRINRRTQSLSEALKDPNDSIGQAQAEDMLGQLKDLADRQSKIKQVTRDIVTGKNKQ